MSPIFGRIPLVKEIMVDNRRRQRVFARLQPNSFNHPQLIDFLTYQFSSFAVEKGVLGEIT
jgi:hypothetical protein